MNANLSSPDLTHFPPRSSRTRLGGFVILPRMLDKCRATLTGKNGAYHYDCPLDKRFLSFAGIDPEKLKEQVAFGKGDGEILDWITENSVTQPAPWEIEQWSEYMGKRGPSDVETKEYFTEELAKLSKTREDILGWADLLDLDDYVSFGGKA